MKIKMPFENNNIQLCEQWTGEDGTGGARTEAEGAKKKRRGAQTTRNKE